MARSWEENQLYDWRTQEYDKCHVVLIKDLGYTPSNEMVHEIERIKVEDIKAMVQMLKEK